MRKFLILIASGIAAVIAVALVVPLFIDVENYRGDIITAVEEASGREFELNGPISLSLLPSPKVAVEKVVLKSPAGFRSDDFITAERIDVAVALFPLLSKNIEVRYLNLIEPRIALEKNAQGVGNWAFDMGDAADEGDGASPQLGVDDLRIEGGYISYSDATSGQFEEISDIDIRLSLASLNGPLEMTGELAARGLAFNFDVDLGRLDRSDSDISVRLGVDDDLLSLFFEGYGDLKTGRLTGDLDVKGGDLPTLMRRLDSGAELPLALDVLRLKSRISLIDQRLSLADLMFEVGPNRLEGQLVLDLAKTNSGPDLRGDFFAVDLRGVDKSGTRLPLNDLALKAKLNEDVVVIEDIKATLVGGGVAQLSGEWRNQAFDGKIGVYPEKPRELISAVAAGVFDSMQDNAFTRLGLTSALHYDADGLALERMNVLLDESQIQGSISASLGERPRYRLDLTTDQLLLDRYDGRNIPEASGEPFALPPVLKTFDADLSLKAGRLNYEELALEGIDIQAALSQGNLTLDTARVGIRDKGQLSAKGIVREIVDQPRADLSLSGRFQSLRHIAELAKVEINPELSKAGAVSFNGMISGTTNDLSIDVTSDIGALNGQLRGRLRDIQNEDFRYDFTLKADHKSLAALLAQFQALDSDSVKSGKTVRADLRLRGAKTDITASGQVAAGEGVLILAFDQSDQGFNASVKGAAPDAYRFIRDLGFDFNPERRDFGAMDLDFAIEGKEQTAQISRLSATLGNINFDGGGTLDMTSKIPVARVDMTAGTLDFNAFLPDVDTGAEAAAEQGSAFRWSEEPFDFAILEQLDGEFSLQAKRVIARAYDVTNARLKITSKGRTLAIEELSGEIFEGRLNMTSLLDASNVPTLNADLSLSNVSVEKATTAAAAIAPLTGTASLTAKIKGAGLNQKALVANLSGNGRFDTRNGVIRRVDIPRINRQFGQLATVNDFVRLTGSALAGGQTAYRQIGFDVVIQNGVLRTQNFASDIDGGADVGLDLRVNLPAWNVDGKGSFRLRDHPDSPPVGVTLADNLSNPTITYQTKALQQYMAVRLGSAVLKGVVTGEGVGLGDLLRGRQQPPAEEAPADQAEPQENGLQEQPAQQQEEPKRPEEQIRDVLLDIFTRKKPN